MRDELQHTLQPTASTEGMTQQSAQNYNSKRQAAEQAIQNANSVINNGDATSQQITEAKNKVEQAQREYVEAKKWFRADKSQLETAYHRLTQNVILTDKKPASVTRYNQSLAGFRNG